MHLTDTLTEGSAKQTWYLCPVCAAEQTTSQPSELTLRRVGNAMRCSCQWPEDVLIRA
jgi:hypothetical protein